MEFDAGVIGRDLDAGDGTGVGDDLLSKKKTHGEGGLVARGVQGGGDGAVISVTVPGESEFDREWFLGGEEVGFDRSCCR